jgi:hypothetical protein
MMRAYDALQRDMAGVQASWKGLKEKDVVAFNALLVKNGLKPLAVR